MKQNSGIIKAQKKRFSEIKVLEHGGHNEQDAFCVMEAASYVANEPWSDHPKCTCPAITDLMINWNDGKFGGYSIKDSELERTKWLKPLIPLLIQTKAGKRIQMARLKYVAQWAYALWLKESKPKITESKLLKFRITTRASVKRLYSMLYDLNSDSDFDFDCEYVLDCYADANLEIGGYVLDFLGDLKLSNQKTNRLLRDLVTKLCSIKA